MDDNIVKFPKAENSGVLEIKNINRKNVLEANKKREEAKKNKGGENENISEEESKLPKNFFRKDLLEYSADRGGKQIVLAEEWRLAVKKELEKFIMDADDQEDMREKIGLVKKELIIFCSSISMDEYGEAIFGRWIEEILVEKIYNP